MPQRSKPHRASGLSSATLVTVKWKKRPPDWDRGRKVGWERRHVPPGQFKKRWF
jgi:hypothetical protein